MHNGDSIEIVNAESVTSVPLRHKAAGSWKESATSLARLGRDDLHQQLLLSQLGSIAITRNGRQILLLDVTIFDRRQHITWYLCHQGNRFSTDWRE